jgi:peptidoglycan/xylan/chitin deacetylase (PgdA/CDA1 family)
MDILVRKTHPLEPGTSQPPDDWSRCTIVTFDDGFSSVFENAIPELSARGIPAAVFVPSSYIGSAPGWIKHVRNGECTQEMVATTKQLRDVDPKLITIGSHCSTHPDLTRIADSEAEAEIAESRTQLELMLDRKVTLLSFPHGSYLERDLDTARNAGYTRVFTIRPCRALRTPEEFVTGRIIVDPNDWFIEFYLKLIGAYRWLPFAFRLKHMVKNLLRVKTNASV